MNDRKMYTPDLAEKFKSRAGQKWRPSNGTEGDLFEEMWCNKCKQCGHCAIIGLSFCYYVTDPEYPNELQHGPDGQPICTAFEDGEK